jgi:hypothetical protein
VVCEKARIRKIFQHFFGEKTSVVAENLPAGRAGLQSDTTVLADQVAVLALVDRRRVRNGDAYGTFHRFFDVREEKCFHVGSQRNVVRHGWTFLGKLENMFDSFSKAFLLKFLFSSFKIQLQNLI